MRSEEIEVDHRAEEVFAPAVTIKQEKVPPGFGHQIKELASALEIQHSGSVYRFSQERIYSTVMRWFFSRKHLEKVKHAWGAGTIWAGKDIRHWLQHPA